MDLVARIRAALYNAALSPRDLAAITKIHYTAIYDALRHGDGHKFRPITEHALSEALDKIDTLIDAGVLPFDGEPSAKERQTHLKSLLGLDEI